MSWFSILPPGYSFIETWVIRVFLVLGGLVIGPWLLLIVYDAILYIVRTSMYEVPVIGGRARNRPRPRAPSLTERPSGRRRGLSMSISGKSSTSETAEVVDGLKQRLERKNDQGHRKSLSGLDTVKDEE